MALKTHTQQANQTSSDFKSQAILREHRAFHQRFGSLRAPVQGPNRRCPLLPSVLGPPGWGDLCSWGSPSTGWVCSQLLGWRQWANAGQARANLDPNAHWFFYHSAQSFWNLPLIWVIHQEPLSSVITSSRKAESHFLKEDAHVSSCKGDAVSRVPW